MTRTNRLRMLTSLLAASAALAPIASAAPVGFVTAIDGIAQVQAPLATSWSPATIDGSISVGDAAETDDPPPAMDPRLDHLAPATCKPPVCSRLEL